MDPQYATRVWVPWSNLAATIRKVALRVAREAHSWVLAATAMLECLHCSTSSRQHWSQECPLSYLQLRSWECPRSRGHSNRRQHRSYRRWEASPKGAGSWWPASPQPSMNQEADGFPQPHATRKASHIWRLEDRTQARDDSQGGRPV